MFLNHLRNVSVCKLLTKDTSFGVLLQIGKSFLIPSHSVGKNYLKTNEFCFSETPAPLYAHTAQALSARPVFAAIGFMGEGVVVLLLGSQPSQFKKCLNRPNQKSF